MNQEQQDFQNRVLALSIVVSLIAGFLAGGLSSGLFKEQPGTGSVDQSELAQEERVVQIVKDASPAVVSIIVTKDLPVIQQRWSDPFGDLWPFGGLFRVPQLEQKGTQKQEIGGGTGFIIKSDGTILTNKHVVEDGQAQYTVLTNDGQRYEAKVLARDPVQDIAVLKISKDDLPTLRMGDSDKIQIGQSIIAIGNALGEFRNTVSVGVISGLKRSIVASGTGSSEQLENVIQTDTAINPGNSGGPLLNMKGEVIGINVAIAQGAQNIAFALPINKAKRDIDQVQKFGKISYPYLGVRYVLVTPEIKSKNDLAVDYGALIQRGAGENESGIVGGSPAEKAGLKEGDIVLEADGQRITQENSLAQIIQNHNVGDTITLKILSGGQEKILEVVLTERN